MFERLHSILRYKTVSDGQPKKEARVRVDGYPQIADREINGSNEQWLSRGACFPLWKVVHVVCLPVYLFCCLSILYLCFILSF